MASQYPYRAQSSMLNSGSPPPSYSSTWSPINSSPFRGPGHSPPPYTPHPVAPGPSYPQSPVPSPPPMSGSLQRREPMTASRGLAICLAIMLLETVLIMYRSDTLAKFINLESTAFRASMEKSALVAEREKSEQERERMRRDRRLWEKVPEDYIPQGAYWDPVWPAYNCRAYGKREYWGMLRNVPEGWSSIDACMNMPVEIKGVTIRRPYRCAFVGESPHIHGYWMVDWDESGCKPWHRGFHNTVSSGLLTSTSYGHAYILQGCTSYRSNTTRIEAQVVGIINRKEQDWRVMCETTPLVWSNINYTSPTHCEARAWGKKVAMWDVPDEHCL
ncbi:hypothetical protein BDM02DRAFT_899049 [Thelephora ganbajun]|uniref:Uncharacterized protein n=1 Tax=Thelephora ganbajun TaxID=370292 RepID=A0ACB6ZNM3_THEGA|nr:hypothetical protein BDM02DRAFT_899049 [Thelephora ganbajun]